MVDARVKKWNERESLPLGDNYAPPFNIAITWRVNLYSGKLCLQSTTGPILKGESSH